MIQATRLTAQDQAWIRAGVRESAENRCSETSVEQIREATELAIAVYTTFAEHGIGRELLGNVSSIPTAVVDAIQFRDHIPR